MTVSCRNYSLVKRGWFVSAGFHYWCKMSLHGRADDTQYKTSHTEVFSRAGVGHHNSCYRLPGVKRMPWLHFFSSICCLTNFLTIYRNLYLCHYLICFSEVSSEKATRWFQPCFIKSEDLLFKHSAALIRQGK